MFLTFWATRIEQIDTKIFSFSNTLFIGMDDPSRVSTPLPYIQSANFL